MAEGVDIWAAEIVLERKMQNTALHLIFAIPHPGFENRRSEYEKERYRRIIQNADHKTIVSEHYFRACYKKRNEFMVDYSSLVIAAWNRQPNGTKNTVDYAIRHGEEL